MTNLDLTYLNQWLGKEQVLETVMSVETANLMNATLNREATFKAGDELPPAWHWLYFHEAVPGGTDSVSRDTPNWAALCPLSHLVAMHHLVACGPVAPFNSSALFESSII